MTADAVLAIDRAPRAPRRSSSTPSNGVLAAAEFSLHPRYLSDGGVEQDPHELLDSVLHAGQQALAQTGRPPAPSR